MQDADERLHMHQTLKCSKKKSINPYYRDTCLDVATLADIMSLNIPSLVQFT